MGGQHNSDVVLERPTKEHACWMNINGETGENDLQPLTTLLQT